MRGTMATKKKTKEATKTFPKNLVGLTEEDAKAKITALGMKCRVRNRDGERFMGTCDYRLDRVNLSISDGKVSNATIG
jgi:hypothetical protein